MKHRNIADVELSDAWGVLVLLRSCDQRGKKYLYSKGLASSVFGVLVGFIEAVTSGASGLLLKRRLNGPRDVRREEMMGVWKKEGRPEESLAFERKLNADRGGRK
jgi:hypothetical protein